MAFLNKLSQVAKNIGDKTGDAIETGKQSAKILSERNAAAKDLEKIGEFYYGLFAAGGEVAAEVLEHCQSAKGHYDAIAAAQAEIERIKGESAAPAAAAPAGIVCPSCGTGNGEGVRFCQNCGTKLEAEAPQVRYCTACGTVVEPGVNFCPSCGQKMGG